MENGKEKIETIYRLNDELTILLETESDLYKKTVENKDRIADKKRKATEGEVFEELRITGFGSPAEKILKKIYPKLFKVAIKRDKKNKELQDYILKEFGFNFREMNLANYMKITEALIDYKLSQK